MFIQKNPYDTSNIKLGDNHELIKERNFNQHNPFNINYSSFYGIEYSLKEFLGLPKDYEIKAFFEHGVSFTSALEAGFRAHESLPTITCSEFRKNTILSQKKQWCILYWTLYSLCQIIIKQIRIKRRKK